MPEDIRVKTSWPSHPKRVKLLRRLGAEAVLAVVDLWTFAGGARPTGDLAGLDAEDLAIAAGYTGDADAWVAELLDLKLLDQDEAGHLTIHDWAEHNPWCAGAEERSATNSRNAKVGWEQRRAAMRTDATRMRPAAIRNAPSGPSGPSDPTNRSPASASPTPEPAGDRDPKPAKKPKREPPGEALALADYLREQLVRAKPDHLLSVPDRWARQRPGWALELDAMCRLDRRMPLQARAVIAWVFGDQDGAEKRFVVESPAALRKKFDALEGRMRASGQRGRRELDVARPEDQGYHVPRQRIARPAGGAT